MPGHGMVMRRLLGRRFVGIIVIGACLDNCCFQPIARLDCAAVVVLLLCCCCGGA